MYDDSLINIMKEDSVSMEFIHQRIGEIVKNLFSDEKERLIIELEEKNR